MAEEEDEVVDGVEVVVALAEEAEAAGGEATTPTIRDHLIM